MAKSTLKKALALLLSVMLVLSALCGAAIGAYAETPDYAGTVEDGITVNGRYFWPDRGNTIDSVQNGDFENGLLWWGPINPFTVDDAFVATKGSDVAQIVTEENGNHYVAFNFGENYTQWNGLATYKIVIPDTKLSVGENLVVLYDHKADTDNKYQFRLDQKYSVAGDVKISVGGKNVLGIENGWEKAYSNLTGTVAERKGTAQNYTFLLQIQSTSTFDDGASTAAFDNIRIAKVVGNNFYDLDGNVLYTVENKGNNDKQVATEVATGKKYLGYTFNFQPYEGTYENGINTDVNKANLLPIYEGPINLNDGFKYWTSKGDRAGYASDMFALTEVDGETCMTYKEGIAPYDGLWSVRIHYPNLVAGDKVRFLYDEKRVGTLKTGGAEIKMVDSSGNELGKGVVNAGTATDGFVAAKTGAVEVTSSDVYFYVLIQCPTVIDSLENGNVFIKNMRMVKENSNGSYTDLLDGVVYYPNSTVYGGTEADGITTPSGKLMEGGSNSYTSWYPANPDGFMNGDFSQGLKFWARNKTAGKASDIASVSGGVLTLTSPSDWVGLRSQHFYINNVVAGDQIRVYFEACDTDTGYAQVKLHTYGTGGAEQKSTLNSKTGGVWKSDMTTAYTVSQANIDEGGLRASIIIANSQARSSQIRNVRLVKYVEDGYHRYLYNLDGTLFKDLYENKFGTEEDGMTTTDTKGTGFNNGPISYYGFMNGDFSQGFKYWGTTFWASTTTPVVGPANVATVNTESDGNKYVTIHSSAAWSGITAAHPVIDESLINVGDKISLLYKFRGVNKLQVKLMDGGNGNAVLAQSYEDKVYGTDSKGWATALAKVNAAISERPTGTDAGKLESGTYRFRIIIAPSEADISFDIDDIKLVKVLDDGSVTELDGTPIDLSSGDVYGSEADGFNGFGFDSRNNVAPLDNPVNLDFSQGFKYWGTKVLYASAVYAPSEIATIDEDGVLTFKKDAGKDNSIVSAKISAKNITVGHNISIAFDYICTSDTNLKVALDYFDANGKKISEASQNLAAAADWTTKNAPISFKMAENIDSYSIRLQVWGDNIATSTFSVRNIKLIEVDTTNSLYSYTYIASSDTEKYIAVSGVLHPYYGTAEKGMYAGNGNYAATKYVTVSDFMNGDFSEGLKYWMFKDVSDPKYLSDDGVSVNEDGQLVINYHRNYSGARSANFLLKGIKTGDVLYARADVLSPAGLSMTFFENNNSTNTYMNKVSNTFSTLTTKGLTVLNASNYFYLRLQHGGDAANNEGAQSFVDNIAILRADRGGLTNAPKVNVDGTLLEGSVYGDANNDGAVDLLDLVRAKKVASGYSDAGIFLAAVDYASGDDTVGAEDIAEVAKYILDAKYVYTK